MTNTELYINGKLSDAGETGVRLNRQLLNPAELNTKDAQYSYSLSLPPTQVNHAIFNYANVEETSDKFNRVYTAELVVNSVRIFQGNFRLSTVTAAGYKGNLYLPAPKTIKDIFGELKLNQNPEYRIPFEDFATSVNLYNGLAATEPQAAIFPYTLYGVLAKVPLNKNANTYSARNLWDSSVRLGMQDLAPSINPLIILKHIFEAQGYTLQGSVFDDEKLTRLYMSYKNAADYVQPWNYGQHAKIKVNGGWSSRYNYRTAGEQLERGINQGNDATGAVFATDLFDATNTALNIEEDSGGNVLRKEVNDNDGVTWINAQIRIPTSGFYKVEFNASLRVYDTENWRVTDPATGVQHIGGVTSNAVNDFNDNIYEIRLCRDRKTADFGLSGPKLNGLFYRNNQPQNTTFDADNTPKYFPQLEDGQLNLVDLAQDKAHLLGFNFGRHEPVNVAPFPQPPNIQPANPDFYNPKAGLGPNAQILAAKPALSWDTTESTDDPTRLAIKSSGWWKYGRIGDFDNEGDNPNVDIDYSGGTKTPDKVLDDQGNLVTPAGSGSLAYRLEGYYLDKITGLQTIPPVPVDNLATRFDGYSISRSSGALSADALWTASDFIKVEDFTGLTVTGEYPEDSSVAVCAWYDKDKEYIGETLRATSAGTLTAAIFTPVTDAVYMRIACAVEELTINGTLVIQDWNVSDFIELGKWANLKINGAAPKNTSVALIGFYDVNLGFLGYQLDASIPRTLTDVVPSPPPTAVYFRISENAAAPLVVTGDDLATDTLTLVRFPLERYFTYKLEAPSGSGYTGYAYIHNGAEVNYLQRVEFVDGVAEFNTAYAPLLTVDPKLTIYLKTKDFDVDGTLTISREIQIGSEDVIDWELTNKYKIDLDNAPANFARRGQFNDAPADGNWYAQGSSNAVVWLNAGELITIASVSSEGRYRRNGMHSTFGLASHEILYDLSIQPFRANADWLKVALNGNGTAAMDWNDPVNFDTDSINLVGFLSADVKTDDFIDNFCKAFNLRLSQLDADTFSLDVKQSKTAVSNQYINLDKIASVRDRVNTPLGLPSLYKIGFTVDVEEEGYVVSGDDGGGQFETGVTEENVVEQKSNFSYNWFKEITKTETGGDVVIPLAVISKADVWATTMPYPEAMRKRYTDQPTRFWYFAGLLNDLGATFEFNGDDIHIARVSNEIPALSILNYKNQRYTILDNYFTILINGSSHYTELEGFLTAQQYEQLDGSILAMFNGDLYYIAELGGYDPAAKNKTKIKLIRKI